ncbi:hypothetical protein DPMN_068681 [Dreissena polymorpha]|uniref:Uncharacterized protein n=1 Tax=Dreissena polymorpha TaxID=45954 RepID=A0A9D4BUD7_DREPO|nr:hypothetical protein DPMN_068681 [Dreissena polymorpha]
MFLQGKRLVKLALEKKLEQDLNVSGVNINNDNGKIADSEATLHEPVDVNNNSESDHDDDVHDPDYVPIKKKRKFSFQSIVSGEFLKIDDTMSDSYSSDSTSDTETCQTFIATKVQD